MKINSIPDFLSHLPVYRGYLVPYFVPKDENGIYQLKYASAEKMNSCLAYHKCCVCFKPLTKGDYWFISGPMGLMSQTDSHPPMHKCCADYSLQVCPHLFFEKTHRTSDETTAKSFQITEKPRELYLVKAGKFSTVKVEGLTLIKYASFMIDSKFEYINGELTKVQ